MKSIRGIFSFALLISLCVSPVVLAGNLAPLPQFNAGDPAKAADVNANFEAVRAAVDGNAIDIGAITAQADYTEFYDATTFQFVTNGTTDETTLRRHAFKAFIWSAAAATQYLVGPVNLPQGAVVTNITCYYYDNDAANNMSIYVSLMSHGLGLVDDYTHNLLGNGTSTTGQAATLYSVSNDGSLTIDNANNSYHYYIYMSDFGGSDEVRFNGCTITYTK